MQYPHAVQALTVHAYNHTVKYFAPGGVYKGHLMALGLSFLEVAYFFGGQFRDPAFTGRKKCQAHDSNLLRKNGEGCQTGMDELLSMNEGVAGCFYMDVDTLARLYSDMAHQLQYRGEFPQSPQHTTVTKWRATWDKFVDETIEKIGQQYWCRKIKQGRTYPSCLQQSGLLDHAFPLLEDDPQYRPPGQYIENWAGTLDEEHPVREEAVPQVPAGAGEEATPAAPARAGEEATPAAPGAPGGIEPDVVVEQVTEETADGEITCLYDSANDPTFCPARPSEPTPEEALTQLLTRGQATTGSVREPPSHREDEPECSTDSDMREGMEGLSLGTVLSQRLGPPPETQPDMEHSAKEASTQQDLKKLRRPDDRSRQLNRAWRDTAEYERQKGELEKTRCRGRSESRLEAKKRAPSQPAGASPKRRSRSRSRGPSAGVDQGKPKAEPPRRADKSAKKQPPLNWIPGPEEEFPMHLAVGTKAHAFILWAENYKLNPECYEVQALQFIPNHVKVTGKIVVWVMWALVNGMMGECHPVPNRIVGLEGTGPHKQSPVGAAFPMRLEEQDDL